MRNKNKKELISIFCKPRSDKSGLDVKVNVFSNIHNKVKKSISLGLVAMTMLTATACGNNADVDSQDKKIDTKDVQGVSLDEDMPAREVAACMLGIKSSWEEKMQFSKEQVIAAQTEIELTTADVLKYYEGTDTEDMSERDAYLKVLNDFASLCEEIISEAENGKTDEMKETLRLANSLSRSISDSVLKLNALSESTESYEMFDIPDIIKVGDDVTVQCNVPEYVWGSDILLATTNSDVLACRLSPCKLHAMSEGTVEVSVLELMTGKFLYKKEVTVMSAEEAKKVEEIKAKAEENHNANKDPLEVTPVVNNNNNNKTENTNKANAGGTVKSNNTVNSNNNNNNNTVKPSSNANNVKPQSPSPSPSKAPVVTQAAPTHNPTPAPAPVVTQAAPTPAPAPVVTEAETPWYPGKGMTYNGRLRWGCQNQEQMAYVESVMDATFYPGWYEDCKSKLTEDELECLNYFKTECGYTDAQYQFRLDCYVAGHLTIKNDYDDSGYGDPTDGIDSAYQELVGSVTDCGSSAQFWRAWFNRVGYETSFVGSPSQQHAWYCVYLSDGTVAHEGVIDPNPDLPSDMIIYDRAD